MAINGFFSEVEYIDEISQELKKGCFSKHPDFFKKDEIDYIQSFIDGQSTLPWFGFF